jgi:hypothetical protein
MVLVDTLRQHQRGADVRVLLCEHPAIVRQLAAELDIPFVAPDEIGCSDWLQMAFLYDVMEFNTAVKPFLLRTLLQQGAERVVYLDPDIQIYGGLDALEKMAGEADCLLTPHCVDPLPDDGLIPRLVDVNRCGQFNLGFVAFRRSPRVIEVLKWWEDRLKKDCISDPPAGLFVDQSWANLFVSFLPHVGILRSQAYNLAYWNMPISKLWREKGQWMTGDGPLVFFHFSGLPKDDLTRVSRHQSRIRAEPGSPLHQIMSEYLQACKASPYAAMTAFPYSFGKFTDGTPVHGYLRRRYRALADVERAALANPFAARAYLESLQDVGQDLHGELRMLREKVAALEAGPLGSLRYRIADRINEAIKRMPVVHGTAKKLYFKGREAAPRLKKLIRRTE